MKGLPGVFLRNKGNIGKVSKRTREQKPIFREQGNQTLQDENMTSKFIKRQTNKENTWKHGNIGQFWKEKKEQGPPLGDPKYAHSHQLSLFSNSS